MPSSSSFETTIDIGDAEMVVKVGYTFYPFYRGARDGRWGPPIEPDEPAHVEIDSITDPSGKEISDQLDDITLNQLEQEALENYGDDELD